ncbi:adenylyl-sulfate kinase [Herminiimonas arsenitoxidans]|uniref:adenylyl-sulfate kinase n=1 Tax=Herminiimonas arsenitoxidans TaxID=1809410 RepID=UPI0009712676|nr:adenylyl-sulfate kinase [Herminiimonas arsenitoxidans]
MNQPSSSNVVWHQSQVTVQNHEDLLGQQPRTLWFIELIASRKSTPAYAMERTLIDDGRACYALASDNVKHGYNQLPAHR